MSLNKQDRYDSLFQFYAEENGLDWQLLKKQAVAESSLDPRARSGVGALGLMQFMPATWTEWGNGGNWTNPEDSIKTGARYMAWLLKQFNGNYAEALAAYNWGIGNMKRSIASLGDQWRGALPKETSNYLEKILV